MVIKIKPKEAPPKYLFGKAARQQQAAKVQGEKQAETLAEASQQPGPSPEPHHPPAPAEGAATLTQRTMRRLRPS